jgi:hypothetical protein
MLDKIYIAFTLSPEDSYSNNLLDFAPPIRRKYLIVSFNIINNKKLPNETIIFLKETMP